MWIYAGNGSLEECTVRGNYAMGNGATRLAQGGAVWLFANSELSGSKTEFEDNRADSGTQYTHGGAIYVYSGSKCRLRSSTFSRNAVSATQNVAIGGAIGLYSDGASVMAVDCGFFNNSVVNKNIPGAAAYGGGVDIAESSNGTFIHATFIGNSVYGNDGRGGAIMCRHGSGVSIRSSQIRANSVAGDTVGGGGVYSSAALLEMESVSLSGNRVAVSGTWAKGAAVYVFEGKARLSRCQVDWNVAESLSGSFGASAAIYVDEGGTLNMRFCSMWGNVAGGGGLRNQLADSYSSGTAMHIRHTGAEARLDDCTFRESNDRAQDEAGIQMIQVMKNPSKIWISATSKLLLHTSSFTARNTGESLLSVASTSAEVIIRGCTVENLDIDAKGDSTPLGIVNSSFTPPLRSVVPTVQKQCGGFLAGERVCDPRAECKARPSGGVECACVGDGLLDKPGTFPDGRQCEQELRVGMLIQSQSLTQKVLKPSNAATNSSRIRIVLDARGDRQFQAPFNLSMVRKVAGAAGSNAANSSREWTSIGDPQHSLDGHHVVWEQPIPSPGAYIALNGEEGKFSATLEHAFQIGLDCRGERPCVSDGDTVETIVQFSATAQVRIISEVSSLISCERSTVFVEGDVQSVKTSTRIRLQVDVRDVDDLPVEYTRADMLFRFGTDKATQLLPVKWNRGSNRYLAEVPEDLTEKVGLYQLKVRLPATLLHGHCLLFGCCC